MAGKARRSWSGALWCSAWLGAVALGGFAGVWTLTRVGDPALRLTGAEAATTLYILDNGFHTDLAIPRAVLEARGGPLAEATKTLGPGDWVLVGWGDAKFYVDQSPISDRLPDGARAFFRPGNPSVVMLDPTTGDPGVRYGAAAHRLDVSQAAMAVMTGRIEQSLDLTEGRARISAERPGDDARFFASRETFWIGHLCNHWAAELLHAGGLTIHPLRSITSGEVVRTVQRAQSRVQSDAKAQAPSVERSGS